MIASLLLLSLAAQTEGVPEVAAEASYYFEIVEGGMQVEERWQLQNQSSREIPASALTLFIDRRAKAIRFPPKSSGAVVGTGAPSIRSSSRASPSARGTPRVRMPTSTRSWTPELFSSSSPAMRRTMRRIWAPSRIFAFETRDKGRAPSKPGRTIATLRSLVKPAGRAVPR